MSLRERAARLLRPDLFRMRSLYPAQRNRQAQALEMNDPEEVPNGKGRHGQWSNRNLAVR
jgi:hypothetical protein